MAKIIIKFPYMLKPGPRMEKANAIQKSLEKDDIVVLDASVEVTVIRDGDDILIDPRPKGEWKFKKFDEETGIPNGYWCPFCGTVKAQVYDNFCGYCGADLR